VTGPRLRRRARTPSRGGSRPTVALTFVTLCEPTAMDVGPATQPAVVSPRCAPCELAVLPDGNSSVRWGELQAYAQLRGRPWRPTPPACCLVRDVTLARFDIEDVVDFVEHEGLELLC
jgi:toxin FitB